MARSARRSMDGSRELCSDVTRARPAAPTVESTSLSVMDVPAARLTFQVYEPDEPDWVGNETRLAEAGLPPSITERKMSPAGASLQLMAAGWLYVQVRQEGCERGSAQTVRAIGAG